MGMQLFEPPNVGGWPVGGGWFSTATMLARSNFGSSLVAGQKPELAAALAADGQTASGLLAAMLDRISPAPLDPNPQQVLASYLLAGGRVVGQPGAARDPGRRAWRACWSARPSTSWFSRETTMQISRRLFIRDGVATVALGLTAPAFLSAIAQAQGLSSRRLVVVYLGGGNDALNTLIPYQDQSYYSRRPTIAIPAGQVLQVGTDAAGRALGLHPRLGGLSNIFNEGRLAIVQRTGYQNSSRSHFEATDIFGTANPQSSTGSGWLGRYLDTLPRPIDSLAAWNTTSETPRSLVSGQTGVPAISNASTYTFASPNRGSAATQERAAAEAMAANAAPGRPHLAFVNSTSRSAIETIDRAARAMSYSPTVAYPNNGFALALRTVAGAIFNGIGSRVYYVQTGGYDTHAQQGAGRRQLTAA